jgi:glycosyltransferase involved in cell wall biosynthesis
MSLPADAFVVCCARRLVPRMGFDVLLKAWSDIVAIHTRDEMSRPFRLLIAGDGELRGTIAGAIAEGMLTDSVALLGRITDEKLAELYRAADVNVVPSLSHEGFGLVVLEAAASGTPTVATRVGGLPEALAGLDATLIVEPDDPTALAIRLIDAANGALPGRLQSRSWAAQHRWNRVAEEHRKLYRGLPRDMRSDKGGF